MEVEGESVLGVGFRVQGFGGSEFKVWGLVMPEIEAEPRIFLVTDSRSFHGHSSGHGSHDSLILQWFGRIVASSKNSGLITALKSPWPKKSQSYIVRIPAMETP